LENFLTSKTAFIGWATGTENMTCLQLALSCIKRRLVELLGSAARRQGFWLSQANPVNMRELPFRIAVFQKE
jgi:hypothetical protein